VSASDPATGGASAIPVRLRPAELSDDERDYQYVNLCFAKFMGALRFCAKTPKPQAETGVNAYACRLSVHNLLNATFTHRERLLLQNILQGQGTDGSKRNTFRGCIGFRLVS